MLGYDAVFKGFNLSLVSLVVGDLRRKKWGRTLGGLKFFSSRDRNEGAAEKA